MTPGAPTPEAEGEWPSRYGPEQAGELPARNLEAQLLSVGVAAPLEAAAAAQLRSRLEAAEAEATQLRWGSAALGPGLGAWAILASLAICACG